VYNLKHLSIMNTWRLSLDWVSLTHCSIKDQLKLEINCVLNIFNSFLPLSNLFDHHCNLHKINKTNIVSGPASLQNIPVKYAFLYTDICLDTKSAQTDGRDSFIPPVFVCGSIITGEHLQYVYKHCAKFE